MTLLQDRMTVSHLWFDSTINDVNTSESQSSASPRPTSISFYFIHSFIYLFVYSNNFVYSWIRHCQVPIVSHATLFNCLNLRHLCIHMVNDVTECSVTIRSPFCGYDTTQCVELNGEDLSCYSNKTQSVSLRKCPYVHWVTNKACSSAITVTNILKSFTYKMAAEVTWHRYGTKLRHSLSPCVL